MSNDPALPPSVPDPVKPTKVPKDHITFDYLGHTFHAVDDPGKLPYAYLENFLGAPGVPQNKPTALHILLGDEQYGAFKALNPTVHDVNEMYGAYGTALGLHRGE